MSGDPAYRCQTCGTNQSGGPYCAVCGAMLQRVCGECGMTGSAKAHFCPHCGTAFTTVPVAPPAVPNPLRRGSSGTPPLDPTAAWTAISSPVSSDPTPVVSAGPRTAFTGEFSRTGAMPTTAEHTITDRRASTGSAFLHAIGALIAMLTGVVALQVAIVWTKSEHPAQASMVALICLGLSVAVWLGTTVWIGRHAGGGMALLAFFLGIVAWPRYVFRQKRGFISRHSGTPAPAFPAYSIATILVAFSLVMGGMLHVTAPSLSPATAAEDPVAALAPPPGVTATATGVPTVRPTQTTIPTQTPRPTRTPNATATATARLKKDTKAAAAAVVKLSRYEAAGSFNTLYDLIHPDAHAEIPRAAAVGWFENDFAPRGPRASHVVDVQFVDWTWPVNGKTYKHTAEVTYDQSFADGSLDRDVVRLVKHEGEWRWFFGRSRAFVDEQIARFVITTGSGNGTNLQAIPYDVDAFWRQTFEDAGIDYDSADYVRFDEDRRTGCGRAAESPAFYCPYDAAVYTANWFQEIIVSEVGDFAWAVVLAHEFGHHVEAELEIWQGEVYSIQLELEADCLAGVYTQDAETRGLVEPTDVEAAITLMAIVADPDGVPWYAADAHGTAEERINAFLNGYNDGLLGCGYTT